MFRFSKTKSIDSTQFVTMFIKFQEINGPNVMSKNVNIF